MSQTCGVVYFGCNVCLASHIPHQARTYSKWKADSGMQPELLMMKMSQQQKTLNRLSDNYKVRTKHMWKLCFCTHDDITVMDKEYPLFKWINYM